MPVFPRPSASLICGIDEVGRGPLAGPVVAAAVILPVGLEIAGLRDSKSLSAQKRQALAPLIRDKALAFALGQAEVAEIDEINILQATFVAMQRALDRLQVAPEAIEVDGNHAPAFSYRNHPLAVKAIVKGDQKVVAIAAASVLAKVARDALMESLEELYPGYGFRQHKGYGTAQHLAALAALGPCAAHRQSFAPVRLASIQRLLPGIGGNKSDG